MQLLLIEDHKDIAANIAEYFAARGDSVTHAVNGENGLRLALEGTRNQVRFQAAAHAAQLLRRCLTEVPPPPRR